MLTFAGMMYMTVFAGPFEEICKREGVTEVYIQALASQRPMTQQALAHTKELMHGLNPLLAALISTAESKNLKHGRILRQLAKEYVRRLTYVAQVPSSLKEFAYDQLPYGLFYSLTRKNANKLLLSEISVRDDQPPYDWITVRRSDG